MYGQRHEVSAQRAPMEGMKGRDKERGSASAKDDGGGRDEGSIRDR